MIVPDFFNDVLVIIIKDFAAWSQSKISVQQITLGSIQQIGSGITDCDKLTFEGTSVQFLFLAYKSLDGYVSVIHLSTSDQTDKSR